ncbi:hypothetical protein RRG08_012123 [Elysia crispata]|uniref:Uncharacterized protein n=1 Tax=Elysia crispata TaxID=231223 RepID=A0AAE0ZQ39_9GAST|nr:hypothetical protein RRG08_012123 [Elysia crispata]
MTSDKSPPLTRKAHNSSAYYAVELFFQSVKRFLFGAVSAIFFSSYLVSQQRACGASSRFWSFQADCHLDLHQHHSARGPLLRFLGVLFLSLVRRAGAERILVERRIRQQAEARTKINTNKNEAAFTWF